MSWKDIKGYENKYQINENGDVKSLKRKYRLKDIILKYGITPVGYYKVNLAFNGKYKTRGIHRLIAEAFIPNPKNLPMINHKDGNKLNNHVNNLEWCNSSHNQKHAIRIGIKKVFYKKGEQHLGVKLNENEVKEIRKMRNNGIVCRAIASKYGVGISCIQGIVYGRNWKHI